jgi:soluble lytic murein transglycosylase
MGPEGLCSLKPSTARVVARETDMTYNGASDLFDPKKNIQIGVYFLSKLIDDFKSIRKALYAYNVGPYKAKTRIAKMPANKDPHNSFTRRVLLAFQNNMSTFPAY